MNVSFGLSIHPSVRRWWQWAEQGITDFLFLSSVIHFLLGDPEMLLGCVTYTRNVKHTSTGPLEAPVGPTGFSECVNCKDRGHTFRT